MSEEIQRVEVITAVQRRQRWSVAEKIRLVEKTLQPGMSIAFVARTHGLSPSLLFKGRRRVAAGGPASVRVDGEVHRHRQSAPARGAGSARSSGCWGARPSRSRLKEALAAARAKKPLLR